ncbi:ABC transporter permease [Sphingomonas rhizophila]|nr:ABC transporter permease [Sphingomonas rhizophila]
MLLAIAAPIFVAVITVLIALRNKSAVPYLNFGMTGAAFWAFAMLPMTVTALSVLMSQMEHGPEAGIIGLPFPGPARMFLAKLIVLAIVVAAMSAWLWTLLFAGWQVVAAMKPVVGTFDKAGLAMTLGKMWAASGLMIVLQLWLALRTRSFVPPLVLGITGTFVAVAAASAREGAYFPWLMPLHILSTDPAMGVMALQIGIIGGAGALLAMIVDLNRREAV